MNRLALLNRTFKRAKMHRTLSSVCEHGQEPIPLKKTPFYDFHLRNGAKMVDYFGYECPSTYSTTNNSLINSHLNTRSNAGLFDVSHMLKVFLVGEDATNFVNRVFTCDADNLKVGRAVYSLSLNDNGGIKDDLIVNKLNDDLYYLVLNACNEEKMVNWLRQQGNEFKKMEIISLNENDSHGLIALQGPLAHKIVEDISDIADINEKMYFMDVLNCNLFGVMPAVLTRCGYTGEDGFEILMEKHFCEKFIEQLMHKHREISLCGLYSRDQLRIEAGLSLYGHEIDEDINPLTAGLTFAVAKKKRETKNFIGASYLNRVPESTDKHLIKTGITSHKKIPRSNMLLFDEEGKKVGRVTSGCRSPILKLNIGMAYVNKDDMQKPLFLNENCSDSVIIKQLPFITTHYHVKKGNN